MLVTLTCLSTDNARVVTDEWSQHGGPANTVTLLPGAASVSITYADKRYPLDIAEWAFENEHATDANAARVIGSL